MVCWSYESAHIVCKSIEEKGSTTITSALYYPLVLSLSLSHVHRSILTCSSTRIEGATRRYSGHTECARYLWACVGLFRACVRALRNGFVLHCARERTENNDTLYAAHAGQQLVGASAYLSSESGTQR